MGYIYYTSESKLNFTWLLAAAKTCNNNKPTIRPASQNHKSQIKRTIQITRANFILNNKKVQNINIDQPSAPKQIHTNIPLLI